MVVRANARELKVQRLGLDRRIVFFVFRLAAIIFDEDGLCLPFIEPPLQIHYGAVYHSVSTGVYL